MAERVVVGSVRADIPAARADEHVSVLARAGTTRVERIVSRGHASPEGFWYDQAEAEWVMVLEGSARLEIEGQGTLALGAGDHVLLPARCRHRVAWTDPHRDTIWLAVFYAE